MIGRYPGLRWLVLLTLGLLSHDACLAQPPAAVDTLAEDLRAGQKRNANSYQRFLRDSYHTVIRALDEGEWGRIRPSLAAQRFQIEEKGRAGLSRQVEITLEGLAYRPGGGPVHPLVIALEIYPQI